MKALDDLFSIDKGHQLALNRVSEVRQRHDAVAYVARSHRNNGVTAWVKPIGNLQPAEAGNISVCLRSRNHALAAFVQPRPFYTTYHVAVLTPKAPMSLQEKLWWCLCIRANRFRFHFGRQANRTVNSLLVPDEVPTWAATWKLPTHDSGAAPAAGAAVDTRPWATFKITALFDLHLGLHAIRRDLGDGDMPLVTASAWNNGVSARVSLPADWPGGQITVANNGSVGAAFYQARPFCASRDVTVLSPKAPLSVSAALFICTILRSESARFNYARKWTIGRMRESEIRLPDGKNGEPDFQAMERFMSTLRLGWALR